MIFLALIFYCTLAFGVHGGEGITGINRQVRNVICALPFSAVAFYLVEARLPYPHAHILIALAFALSYVGANMGFDKWPLWFKGLVTLPPFGAASLPLAYWIGYKTRWTNVLAEYLSGTFYGIILCALVEVLK